VHAVLEGEGGPGADIVLLNAAAAIYVGGVADSLEEGLVHARESIDSGAARDRLERLIRCTEPEEDPELEEGPEVENDDALIEHQDGVSEEDKDELDAS
jgi:hypothetical protein